LVRDGRVVLDERCVAQVSELADAVIQASKRATAQKNGKLGVGAEGAARAPALAAGSEDPLEREV
jgi:hypothetical protein